MSDELLRIAGLGKRYGATEALRGADLSVRRGEFICLLGASGCGKSTLLRIIAGFETATTGRGSVDGRVITGPGPDRGMVFQDYGLFPWLTVRDNVGFGPKARGLPRRTVADLADRFVATVGLTRFSHAYPHQLSGGMKQRAQLARALALQTDILLMDEPFAALDEQTRMVLGEDLSVLLARTGKTIVFVTHSLVEAVFLADRVAVFTARPGRIKTIMQVDEPHPRKRAFMTSEKLSTMRNELYELLHDEVRRTMELSGTAMADAH